MTASDTEEIDIHIHDDYIHQSLLKEVRYKVWMDKCLNKIANKHEEKSKLIEIIQSKQEPQTMGHIAYDCLLDIVDYEIKQLRREYNEYKALWKHYFFLSRGYDCISSYTLSNAVIYIKKQKNIIKCFVCEF